MLRWNEDYSYLKTAPKSDLFDPIKYIPLGPDDWYLSLGGQYRFRYEYFNNVNFSPAGSAQDEDGYYLNRLMVHADRDITSTDRGRTSPAAPDSYRRQPTMRDSSR